MNIGFYSHYFTPEIGAPSARIYDLARQWISHGQGVEAITCFPNHPSGTIYPGYRSGLYMHENLDGISVHRHWTFITPNKGFVKKTLGHISYLPSAAILSTPKLKNLDITIGTSPTFFAAIAAQRAARHRRVPFVMEIRDLWPAIFVELGILKNPTLIRWLERLEMSLYHRAARIVTVTESFRRNLLDRGIPAKKVVTIPNGADPEFWHPEGSPDGLRQRLNLSGCFVVLYIGAHGISQALARVLESARLLQQHSAIKFVFVGEGAEKEMLLKKAQGEGISNVTFLEPVGKDEVKSFYALADVCLVPLRNIPLFETFIPSKMFEMMAMGKPIVASVKGEAAAILERSQGAIIVEPEDSRALAEGILELYRNREERWQMGRNGREFVKINYSRASLAALYLDTLKETVAECQVRT